MMEFFEGGIQFLPNTLMSISVSGYVAKGAGRCALSDIYSEFGIVISSIKNQ